MSRGRSERGGNILPHDRDTVFNATIIGDTLEVDQSHATAVHATEQNTIDDATRKEHRRRIKHIYTFFLINTLSMLPAGLER